MKTHAIVLTVGMVLGTAALGRADLTSDLNTQATTMNNLATSNGETKVTGKIAGDFNTFLGSDSTTVVTGLRNGTPITLTRTTTVPSTTPGGLPTTTTTATVITPPTGHMGHGNVYISLALAKQQLSGLGITQPTPQQLQAALTGGTITQTTGTGATAVTTSTQLDGILTLRSQNMGWGQIAQKLGYKLGPVMSGMKSANQSITTAALSSKGNKVTTTSGSAGKSSGSAIISGSGKSHGNADHGISSGKGSGDGIVSASGKDHGNSHGMQQSGIVSGGGGAAASTSGIVSARGAGSNGLTNGKGHSK
jgi:hypothetical protein